MSQGEVKNPETDGRVGNKSGHQGRSSNRDRQSQNQRSNSSDNRRDRL